MKAPFPYFGGKSGMARAIVDLLPPHRVYVEPFAGSLAVLFAKPPAPHEVVNDLNHGIVTFFRVLRDRPEDLERVCSLTPYARHEYHLCGARDDTIDDLELARRFWVRINQSFAKTDGGTGWSVTTARTQSPPASSISRIRRFAPAAERLATVTIESCDGADLVDRLATDDTALYVDPPYLSSTRVSRSGNGGDYLHDMGTPEAHERLAEVLTTTPATVVLSGYPSALYDRLYADWWHTDIAVTAFSSNAKTSARGGRIERIWCNREPAVATLDLWGTA